MALLRLVLAVFAAAVALAAGFGASAQETGPVLAAADLREGASLDGEWTWSIDPYRDGQAGFHGGEPGEGYRRYDDVDVVRRTAGDPVALYEYDMDRSPVADLPGGWIGHASEMRHYQGLVWYQKRFDAVSAPGQRSFLRFGAVNYRAEVWLNGRRLGVHEGGFTPFAFEATGILRESGNRLVVAVDSQRDALSIPPPVTDWETYGGITRSVRLLQVPETFVDDAWVRLEGEDGGTIAIDVRFDGAAKAGQRVTARIEALGLEGAASTDAGGRARIAFAAPAALERWSPATPRLYDVTVTAGEDRWSDRVGLRTIATDGPRTLLNGEPIFLRGISIHEEELGENPVRRVDAAAARELLALARDGLGANFVRLAHYPHGGAMVRAADEMGLIVWSEIPVYWRVAFDDAEALGRARAMLGENIRRDRNRASIALWSVGNETPVGEARNRFMRALVEEARRLDPSRLITAALLTGQEGEGPRRTIVMADPLADALDVLAVNAYNGWYGPDRLEDLPGIEWRMPNDKPLVVSEIGADALAGLREPELPTKFSEDFQAEYYRQTLAMLAQIPTLAGISPWILKDFRSPRRQRPEIQDGWNRKGLVDPVGRRKLAFRVLADWYVAKAAAAE